MAKTIEKDILLSEAMVTPGFKVDFAVGTTYSLDLQYLLGITVFLGLLGEVDELLRKSPHYLLNAVLESRDKFMVFCNASNISEESLKIPKPAQKLFSLLENSIKPICLSKNVNKIVSFHPKVWIIKETEVDGDLSQIKVIVSSRNMTQSGCLDIAAVLTGKICNVDGNIGKVKPLWEFLEWLKSESKNTISKEQTKKIDALISDLKKVRKFDVRIEDASGNPEVFDDYEFIPIGMNDENAGHRCFDEIGNSRDCVVMSPFIDEVGLKNIFTYAGRKTLITRKEWLSQISEELFEKFQESDGVYVVKGELLDSDDVTSDLHAKMYFSNNAGRNYLYLGSTNATKNGFYRNAEFLLKLRYSPNLSSYNVYRNELINDERECLFERITQYDTQAESPIVNDEEIRKAVIIIQNTKATVESSGELWNVKLTTSKLIDGIKIYSIHRPDMIQQLSKENTFVGFKLVELSELYVVEAGGFSRIVKLQTKGLPTKERDIAIKNSIIDSPSKFLDYLGYILSDSPESFITEREHLKKILEKIPGGESKYLLDSPLYEDFLRLSYSEPDRIIQIKDKIDGLDKKVIPEGFMNFYSAFEKAAKTSRRK